MTHEIRDAESNARIIAGASTPPDGGKSARFEIRRATVSDAAALARHRAEMFRDMGTLPQRLYGEMLAAAHQYFVESIPAGEYMGWVAFVSHEREAIIAGAGMQLQRVLPGVQRHESGAALTLGPQGLVLNVFTERPWRRQGIARRLMHHVLDGARAAGVSRLVLHASEEGRPLYAALGFEGTNEMRYTGRL